ncbi:MAG TPA: ABC transporter permease, partial [Actinomycetota bacterium]|nr:ABC transporter permease [Actinomycetota bacterium]
MQPTAHAARLGLSRGWTEFRHYLTYPQELGWNLFFVTVFGVVLLFQRNATVEGSTLPLAMLT